MMLRGRKNTQIIFVFKCKLNSFNLLRCAIRDISNNQLLYLHFLPIRLPQKKEIVYFLHFLVLGFITSICITVLSRLNPKKSLPKSLSEEFLEKLPKKGLFHCLNTHRHTKRIHISSGERIRCKLFSLQLMFDMAGERSKQIVLAHSLNHQQNPKTNGKLNISIT